MTVVVMSTRRGERYQGSDEQTLIKLCASNLMSQVIRSQGCVAEWSCMVTPQHVQGNGHRGVAGSKARGSWGDLATSKAMIKVSCISPELWLWGALRNNRPHITCLGTLGKYTVLQCSACMTCGAPWLGARQRQMAPQSVPCPLLRCKPKLTKQHLHYCMMSKRNPLARS